MDRATEANLELNLTEYEASVLTGALAEYAIKWLARGDPSGATATNLREQIQRHLPFEWIDG